MIIYFSGTGNSRLVAEVIANEINDDIIDVFDYIRHRQRLNVESSQPLIFVSPTYAWRLPRIFSSLIQDMEIKGNRCAYFVMTCGEDIGNASRYIQKLCESKDLEYRGVVDIVMPENYLALFPVPDEDASNIIVEKGIQKIKKSIKYILEEKELPPVKDTFIDKQKSGIINDIFYKVVVKDKAFYTNDKCVSCGICVQKCPLNNIKLIDGKVKWNHECTHCMACLSYCPAGAIEYGKKTVGKRRYCCEYEVKK